MTIGLIAHVGKEGAAQATNLVIEELKRHQLPFLIEKATAALIGESSLLDEAALAEQSDLLLVMGGDGSILRALYRSAGHLKPIFGLNIGSLGFLTCLPAHDYQRAIQCLAEKSYCLSKRSLLEVVIESPGKESFHAGIALNDLVISRGERSRLVSLSVTIDEQFSEGVLKTTKIDEVPGARSTVEECIPNTRRGEHYSDAAIRDFRPFQDIFLTEYHADGLIIATPTGSTAYSLAAGGPIVMPESKVLLITAICPHVLSNRSLVVADQSTITITPTAHQEVFMSIDGCEARLIKEGERLIVRSYSKKLPLVMLPGTTFPEILRQKLEWRGSSIKK